MTTPDPHDPRQASLTHLEIVEHVIETIQDTYPDAAILDCHQQMRDILTRIKNTLDHPVLFAAHIIVYLVKAVRFSRRWATLVKNIPTLHTFPSSHPLPPSTPSTPSISSIQSPSPASSLKPPASSLPSAPFHHSIETRLRIRAFALALEHERHIAQKLPPNVPKPDLTTILPTPRPHSSALSTQHSALSSHPSLLSLKPKAYSLQPVPPLFPSEAFWTSRVQTLQLRLLANITRALDYISVAYLAQYDFPISSIPSIPSIFPGLKTQASSLKPHLSSLHSQDSGLKTQDSGLRTQDSSLSTQHSPPTPLSHPPAT